MNCRLCNSPLIGTEIPHGTCGHCGKRSLPRPPCEYDGQDFFAFIVDTPVCLDCWEFYMDQAPLHAGVW